MIDRSKNYISTCMVCGASGAPVLFIAGCRHCELIRKSSYKPEGRESDQLGSLPFDMSRDDRRKEFDR